MIIIFFHTAANASRSGEFGSCLFQIRLKASCRYHAVIASFFSIRFSMMSIISRASYSIRKVGCTNLKTRAR